MFYAHFEYLYGSLQLGVKIVFLIIYNLFDFPLRTNSVGYLFVIEKPDLNAGFEFYFF